MMVDNGTGLAGLAGFCTAYLYIAFALCPPMA